MIKVIRYTGILAVLFLLLVAAWASIPVDKLSSDKLGSLNTKKAYLTDNLSDQYKDSKNYPPALNPRSQAQPVSEPVSMLLLGTGLIGLSIVGKKIFKH